MAVLYLVFLSGFKLVKQNRLKKFLSAARKKKPVADENFFGFANHFMKNAESFN